MHIRTVAEMIKKHEGLRLMPYRCTSGKLTIGYGRNLQDQGITCQEAEILLQHDIQKCYAACMQLAVWPQLCQARQLVLLDMCYNLGIGGLKQFSKMLAALARADYAAAAAEMLDSAWAKQVKSRAVELAEIMKTGEIK